MNSIKELLNDEKSILVFDIDGVLAVLEFGEHNHYFLSDEEWDSFVDSGNNSYTEDKVSKRMQDFLKTKDKKKVLLLEFGVGFNTPAIIRNPFEWMTYENENFRLIRFNENYSEVSGELGDRAMSVSDDMGSIIELVSRL